MGVSFNSSPVRTTQDYGIQVARGEIGGAEPLAAFGRIIAGGPVTKQIIWPNGAFTFPVQSTGETVSLASTSPQDAVGGTGVEQVEVHYLDIDLNPQAVTITLTGATPVVAAITGLRFIQCLHLVTAGSALSAVGEITAYREGTPTAIFSLIAVGQERCTSSLRMVPKSKRCIVAGVAASATSGTAAAKAVIEIIASEIDTHQYVDPFIMIPFGSIGSQDNGLTYTFTVPPIFKEGTVIGMRVTTDKAADVSGVWFGWVEDVPVPPL